MSSIVHGGKMAANANEKEAAKLLRKYQFWTGMTDERKADLIQSYLGKRADNIWAWMEMWEWPYVKKTAFIQFLKHLRDSGQI